MMIRYLLYRWEFNLAGEILLIVGAVASSLAFIRLPQSQNNRVDHYIFF
jgi:hypothetical protein